MGYRHPPPLIQKATYTKEVYHNRIHDVAVRFCIKGEKHVVDAKTKIWLCSPRLYVMTNYSTLLYKEFDKTTISLFDNMPI